jgi:PIN domain nuclease of toxin-antitoxin system
MNLLLDTHALLQFLAGDERIPTAALDALTDARASRSVSMASLWEIAIKVGNGKLAIGILPIETSHVYA